MNGRTLFWSAVLVVFGAFSTWATLQVGYLGIFEGGLHNPGSQQVSFDLCVALLMLSAFLVRDARERGLNIWPWMLVMPFVGSFAPLGYLIYREVRQ